MTVNINGFQGAPAAVVVRETLDRLIRTKCQGTLKVGPAPAGFLERQVQDNLKTLQTRRK